MSTTKLSRILAALCGLLGVVALGVYYSGVLIPIPPANASAAQVIAFGTHHQSAILLDTWLQAIGSLLTVVFALAIIHFAGASTRFWGLLTMLASTILLAVGLSEDTFAIAAVQAASIGHITSALASSDTTYVFGHIFLMVPAPLFFVSLGAVLVNAKVLPLVFGYLALALGIAFAIIGCAGLFSPLAAAISNYLLMGQVLWIIAAAIALMISSDKKVVAESSKSVEAITSIA